MTRSTKENNKAVISCSYYFLYVMLECPVSLPSAYPASLCTEPPHLRKKGRGGGKGMYTGYIQYAIFPKRTHKIFVRLFRQKALQEIVTVTH